MSNMLEHRGYLGSVLYSDEDETFHGRLEFIRDLVTYEANDAVGLKSAFQEAVDDYLLLCEEQKRAPDIPGNIRPEGSLHSAAMLRARLEGISLNAVLTLIALVSCGTLIFLMWTGVEGGSSGKWQVSLVVSIGAVAVLMTGIFVYVAFRIDRRARREARQVVEEVWANAAAEARESAKRIAHEVATVTAEDKAEEVANAVARKMVRNEATSVAKETARSVAE